MKIFETIHAILIVAFLLGLPVAVSTRPDGEPFSIRQGLIQGGCTACCIIVLLVCNMLVARIAARLANRKDNERRA